MSQSNPISSISTQGNGYPPASPNGSIPYERKVEIEQIQNLLNTFFDPATSNEKKQQIEIALKPFKQSPFCLEECFHMLTLYKNEYILWFAASTLEDLVENSWDKLGDSKQFQLQAFLLDYIVKHSDTLPAFVSKKIAKIYVDIGKIVWPHKVPDYLAKIETLIQALPTCRIGLHLLILCAEEFTNPSHHKILSDRRKELQQLLITQLPDLMAHLSNVLNYSIQCLSGQYNVEASVVQEQDTIASLAIGAILQFVEWAPLGQYLSQNLVSLLFQFALYRTQPRQQSLTSSASLVAIECLTEMLNKKCVPKEFEQFVVLLTTSLMNVLECLTNQSGNLNSLMDSVGEDYLDNITEFLRVFLENHLFRLEHRTDFAIHDFLQLLYNYTCRQPHSIGFLNCIQVWDVFVDYVVESEQQESHDVNRRNALLVYENGLGLLMSHLVDRCRFYTNFNQLEELNDKVENNKSETILSDEEEDVEVSELKDFTKECITLILRIAELPSCTGKLLTQLLPIAEEGIQQIKLIDQKASPNVGTEAFKNEQYGIQDITVICEILSSVSGLYYSKSGGTMEDKVNGWKIFQMFLDVGMYVVKHRLHTRGSVFVDLVSELLSSVRRCASCLPVISSTGGSSEVSLAANNIVGLVINLLDTTIVPAPENVMSCAMDLLATIPYVITSDILHSLPSMQYLRSNTHMISLHLPLKIQGKLYTAVSNSLLPGSLGSRAPEWEGRKTAYIQFASPVMKSLTEVANTIQHNVARGNTSDVMIHLKRDAIILKYLARAVKDAPKPAKEAFYAVISSSLPNLFALLTYYLKCDNTLTSKHMETADHFIRLFVAILSAVRKEVPKEFITQTIGFMVSLFQQQDVTMGVSNVGKEGTKLLHHLLQLLAIIMDESTSAFDDYIFNILDLCLDSLKPILFHPAYQPICMPSFLSLSQQLLVKHYRFFVVSSMNEDAVRSTSFSSPQSQKYFLTLFEAIESNLKHVDVSPQIASQVLKLYLNVNESHHLFHFIGFQLYLGKNLISTLLNLLLLSRQLNLLQEEILLLLYAIASADFSWFYNEILFQYFLSRFPSDSRGFQYIKNHFHAHIDQPSFHANFISLINDYDQL